MWYNIQKVPSEVALAFMPASSPPSPEVATLTSFLCFLVEMVYPDSSTKGLSGMASRGILGKSFPSPGFSASQ